MLYVNSAVLHIGVYFWNRKHNVSPHEQEGSSGVAGMAMSAMSAPVYVQALKQALLRQEPGFVVTRKGAVVRRPPRRLPPAPVLGGCCSSARWSRRSRSATCTWPSTPGRSSALLMCLLPVALWLGAARAAAPGRGAPVPLHLQHRPRARDRPPPRRGPTPSQAALAALRHESLTMIRRKPSPLRRLRNAALVGVAVAGVVAANGRSWSTPPTTPGTSTSAISRTTAAVRLLGDRRAAGGVPAVGAIHAALLHTGKVLLIAGSGNNAERFEAGTFRSILWDPVSGDTKEIPTPEDLFCAGHAYLPDGNLLIAGGTREYEQLEDQVDRAAGVLVAHERPRRGLDPARGHRVRRAAG